MTAASVVHERTARTSATAVRDQDFDRSKLMYLMHEHLARAQQVQHHSDAESRRRANALVRLRRWERLAERANREAERAASLR